MIEKILEKYDVLSSGEIVNKKTKKTIRPQDNGRGYKKVTLTIDGVQIQQYVHRLVAKKFIINPNQYPQVNHIDGNKSNNSSDNLEWCTNRMNQLHAHANGLKENGNKLWNGKFSDSDIHKIRQLKIQGVKQCVIAKEMKVSKGTISEILSGKRYKHISNNNQKLNN